MDRTGTSCAITDALFALVRPDDPLVILHSSLPHLGLVSHRLQWQVIGALRALIRRGTTVIVPTFTFSFTKGRPFRRDESPSEVGVVGDWCMKLPEFVRTPNPLFSVAVAGPLQSRILECDHQDCYGEASVLAAWEQWNGRIVLLGAPWSSLTFVHRMEQEHAVPYRSFHELHGLADLGEGLVQSSVRAYVRDDTLGSRMDLSFFVQLLKRDHHVTSAVCGRGRAHSVRVADVAAVARRELPANPFLFLGNGSTVAHRIEARKRSSAHGPLRVLLAGPGDLQLLASCTQRAFDDLEGLPRVEVQHFSGTAWQGGMWNESLDAQVDFAFVPLRLRDLWPADLVAGEAEAELVRLLERLRAGRQGIRGPLVVSELVEDRGVLCLVDRERRATIRRMNEILDQWALAERDVHVLSVSALSTGCSGALHDGLLELTGTSDYSAAYAARLAAEYAGLVADSLELTTRMIVLDLDGTLWDGTLAEGGVGSVNVRHGAGGRAFYRFQLVLRQLLDEGIILALSSKNNEQDVVEVFTNHPDMVLRLDDFVGWRCNWEPKWQNVRALCEEIGVGLGSVLFVDDSRVECEEMRARNPQVSVLPVPDDPALLVDALLEHPLLRRIERDLTGRARTASYQGNRMRAAAKSRAEDLAAYYAALRPTLHLSDLTARNCERAMELIRKTNRFNFSLTRYSAEQLETAALNVVILGSEDSYAALEDMGVLVWRRSPQAGITLVENWVLSCRALGRGLEEGILGWLVEERRSAGDLTLAIKVRRGDRNAKTLEWLNLQGFAMTDWEHAFAGQPEAAEGGGDVMILGLRESTLKPPFWLTIRDARDLAGMR